MENSSKNSDFLKFRQGLGQNIQALRKTNNLSQEQLADLVGIDRVAIGYIEQGIRSPKLETLYNIAKALKVKPKDLFES